MNPRRSLQLDLSTKHKRQDLSCAQTIALHLLCKSLFMASHDSLNIYLLVDCNLYMLSAFMA